MNWLERQNQNHFVPQTRTGVGIAVAAGLALVMVIAILITAGISRGNDGPFAMILTLVVSLGVLAGSWYFVGSTLERNAN